MNKNKQQIAIAQACGWGDWNMTFNKVIDGELFAHKNKISGLVEVPDYLNDLNAMASAEKILTDEQWIIYAGRLATWDLREQNPINPWLFRHTASAPAAQRAEQFLRTIGKWEAE
jgi:hypothetical protein